MQKTGFRARFFMSAKGGVLPGLELLLAGLTADYAEPARESLLVLVTLRLNV